MVWLVFLVVKELGGRWPKNISEPVAILRLVGQAWEKMRKRV